MYFSASGVSMILTVSAILIAVVLSIVLGNWYFCDAVLSEVTVTDCTSLWENAELHIAITISATGVCLNNFISIFLNNSYTLIGYFIEGKSATQVSNRAVITHG